MSFVVPCDTQREIDYYWRKLTEGGETSECGWLKDRYGVSRQIVPTFLMDIIEGKDPARAERVMRAVMAMSKLDLKKLVAAAKRR